MSSVISRERLFLISAGGVGLLAFGLPLLVAPMRWARALRWGAPADAALAIYLGRSLGAVATALGLTALWGARDPRANRILFPMTALMATLLAAVHLWGAFKERQPWTESAETLFWAGMAGAAVCCRPGDGPGSQEDA